MAPAGCLIIRLHYLADAALPECYSLMLSLIKCVFKTITQVPAMKEKILAFALALTVCAPVGAVDFGKLSESVDKEKASDSVDKEQLKSSISTEGVDYEQAAGSVDTEKAKEAVDIEKARGALGY